MLDSTKVTLTILGIPGRTRHCIGKRKVREEVEYFDKKTKTMQKKYYWHKELVYEYEPCSKRINLSKEFYDYATSDSVPVWFSHDRIDLKRQWKKMNKELRLASHLACICEENGGTDFVYNVLED